MAQRRPLGHFIPRGPFPKDHPLTQLDTLLAIYHHAVCGHSDSTAGCQQCGPEVLSIRPELRPLTTATKASKAARARWADQPEAERGPAPPLELLWRGRAVRTQHDPTLWDDLTRRCTSSVLPIGPILDYSEAAWAAGQSAPAELVNLVVLALDQGRHLHRRRFSRYRHRVGDPDHQTQFETDAEADGGTSTNGRYNLPCATCLERLAPSAIEIGRLAHQPLPGTNTPRGLSGSLARCLFDRTSIRNLLIDAERQTNGAKGLPTRLDDRFPATLLDRFDAWTGRTLPCDVLVSVILLMRYLVAGPEASDRLVATDVPWAWVAARTSERLRRPIDETTVRRAWSEAEEAVAGTSMPAKLLDRWVRNHLEQAGLEPQRFLAADARPARSAEDESFDGLGWLIAAVAERMACTGSPWSDEEVRRELVVRWLAMGRLDQSDLDLGHVDVEAVAAATGGTDDILDQLVEATREALMSSGDRPRVAATVATPLGHVREVS